MACILGNLCYGAPLNVTCTTGMISDLARQIGGDHVSVLGLMGPGVDPHLYKATPGDLKKLSQANLIFYNGLHLEGRMADILIKLARRVPTVQVTETMPPELLLEPPEFNGNYDPHVWMDVSLWSHAATCVRDSLIEYDPDHADDYRRYAAEYLEKLKMLDAYARREIATIPEAQRVMVTAHDAFGYMGRAYGMEVLAIQGLSTATEYGLRDLERLKNVIVSRKIKAVFVESSVPIKSMEALVAGCESKGHQVRIGGALFSDAMGAEGSKEGTYIGMIEHNVNTIVGALK
jgi:manganese/zinc/iron transport system substrate-binding protein